MDVQLRGACRVAEHEHRRAAGACGAASRSSASTGSRSGTTSTRPTATGNPHCLEAITTHTALAATTERVQVRFARLLRRLPASRRARQRDGDPRPGRERSGRARTRRRMAATGVRRLRHPVRNARRAATQARRVHPVRARAARRRSARRSKASSSRCATRSANRSPCRSGCRSGSVAAARRSRCASAREHADGWNVPFIPPDVWAHKAQGPRRALRARGPRSGVDHQDHQRRHGVHRRGTAGASSARWRTT